MVEELAAVGKSVPRYDAIEKVTGRAKFSADESFPEMLWGKILRSPHGHARIGKIDTTKAEALPGVEVVITAKDMPDKSVTFPPESRVLAKDEVRREGDPVAAVAAVSEEVADEALDLIEVTYDPLPAVYHAEEAIEPGAPIVVPGAESNLVGQEYRYGWGDIVEGFAQADLIMEDRYTLHNASAAPIGLDAHLAMWDEAGNLTVWKSTQRAAPDADGLAEYFDIPPNKVRVIGTYSYGIFGGGQGGECVAPVTCVLAKKAGKPVMVEVTREEELRDEHGNPSTVVDLKMGVTDDGLITAIHTKTLWESGWPMSLVLIIVSTASGRAPLDLHYYPNCLSEGKIAYTNTMIRSAYRGFGCVNLHWPIEQMMDQVAEQLGMDPVEFRLKNKAKTGQPINPGPELFAPQMPPSHLSSTDMEQCITKAAESIGWAEKWKGFGKPTAVNGAERRAVGFADFIHGCDKGYSTALVRVGMTGDVDLQSCFGETGTGAVTVMAQICAEELGVLYEDVRVTACDTQTGPWENGSYSSRTTLTCGLAVQKAARMCKEQIINEAAALLEVEPEELEIKERRIYVKADPERELSLHEVVEHIGEAGVIGCGSNKYHIYPTRPMNYGSHAEEIKVDTETGRVEVVGLAVSNDCGRAVNPRQLETNMMGGVMQGIGYAIMEEFVYDEASGVLLNPRFIDYHIPTVLDVPEELFDMILVEPIEPLGPFGAKGASEGIMDPVPAIIANAIYNAVGVRIKDGPITPAKILKGLGKI